MADKLPGNRQRRVSVPMPYQPIEDYGIVGNLRTAALIGKKAAVFESFPWPAM
jgi:hypothetical protein